MPMKNKLGLLRRLMKSHDLQAYLIPSADPHQSEYVPEFWKRRQFVTGFTGSAGDAVVTLDQAGLWTDSRYFLQAERELEGSGFSLFRFGQPRVPSWQEWIAGKLSQGEALGVDPRLISHKSYELLGNELSRRSVVLKAVEKNLVDEIWLDRLAPPSGPLILHEEKYAGESIGRKLERLRLKLAEEAADAHVITLLDAIAWLFNIRGSDVEYNPVAIAYAVITRKKAALFIDLKKVSPEIKKRLDREVEIAAYDDFPARLKQLAAAKNRVWLDEASVSEWVVSQLAEGSQLIFKPSPIALFKAVKNEAEIAGFKAAHVRDGVAMVKFLRWLESEVPRGEVTEVKAAEKLEELRSRQPLFRGLSFRTISAYAGHAALPHYSTSPETDVPLRPEGIYLIDSGSQYLDATTDITRTVALGPPTEEQRDRLTRVLKGLLSLTRASFPRGTAGKQLDTLARLALWEVGLNFGHGTGHGVGAFLNVHEGPQAISYYRCIGVPLEPAMVTSIEPGYYKEGEYGLRLENMVLVVKDEVRSAGASVFYTFETLTLCPIDLRLVKKEMLTPEETGWLNSYHQKVRERLTPFLEPKETAWLEKATRPL
jgi:Xaa-Pro aminopeptidase